MPRSHARATQVMHSTLSSFSDGEFCDHAGSHCASFYSVTKMRNDEMHEHGCIPTCISSVIESSTTKETHPLDQATWVLRMLLELHNAHDALRVGKFFLLLLHKHTAIRLTCMLSWFRLTRNSTILHLLATPSIE